MDGQVEPRPGHSGMSRQGRVATTGLSAAAAICDGFNKTGDVIIVRRFQGASAHDWKVAAHRGAEATKGGAGKRERRPPKKKRMKETR